MSQFLWGDRSFELVKTYEQEKNHKYTWIMKMRPDMKFYNPIILPLFKKKTVFGYPYRKTLIIDWWAIMTRDIAPIYFSVGESMRNCDFLKNHVNLCYDLKKDDVECFLVRWLYNNSVNVNQVWGRKHSSSLVHFEDNKISSVSSEKFG